MFVDLHIHSCLSPCAEDDMTPANICGMARLKGLDAIAVTDHNLGANLPHVQQAAAAFDLILLPGLEITTREEVHLLGYFPTVAAAVAAGEFFASHLPPLRNRPDHFGHQLLMDVEEHVLGAETRLLLGATSLSLTACAAEIRRRGGLAVPAHINRGSNGLLVNLGMMPEQPDFPLVEVWDALLVDPAAVAGRRVISASDAHRLGDIREAVFALPVAERSLAGLWAYLAGA